MPVVLYFSRKQTQALSIDIETKVLNDLTERLDAIIHVGIERPELVKVISKVESNWSSEVVYAYDIMFTFAHAFHMRLRKVLSDNEWTGWLRWMKSAFEQGKIMEIWESTIEVMSRRACKDALSQIDGILVFNFNDPSLFLEHFRSNHQLQGCSHRL